MTLAIQEKFFTDFLNKAINPDKSFDNQCVDVIDGYAEYIFGVPWVQCVGPVNGAKNLLDAVPDKFWIRTDNDASKPHQLPSRGDVVVYGGTGGNEFGHTAVIMAATAEGAWVFQQDGFAPPLSKAGYSLKPAHIVFLPWYGPGTGMVSGWLSPKQELIKRIPEDALIPDGVVVRNGYYLEQNPNPVASQFGIRRQPNPKYLSGVIGVHTAESATALTGADSGAESTGQFIARRGDFGSYHMLSDWDSVLPLVRPELEAWADMTNNPHALSISMALQAARWLEIAPLRRDKIVKVAAYATSLLVKDAVRQGLLKQPVPARRISAQQAIAGSAMGFYGHGETNPGTRYDPGAHFNWSLFLAEYARLMGQPTSVVAKPSAPIAVPVVKPAPAPTTNYVPDRHWVVEAGEYFGMIAQHYGDTVGALAQYNGIKDPNKLQIGEWIWPRDGKGTWTVHAGDTLSKVVDYWTKNLGGGVTVDSICNANGINDPGKIKVGMRLQIR